MNTPKPTRALLAVALLLACGLAWPALAQEEQAPHEEMEVSEQQAEPTTEPEQAAEPEEVEEAEGGEGSAEGHEAAETGEREPVKEPRIRRRTPVQKVLLYVPNRAVDVLDIVRARVRLGGGGAIQARVTKPASVFFGSYDSAYVGLPGHRNKHKFPPLFGADGMSGVGISLLDNTTDNAENQMAPRYGDLEVGAGAHVAVVGVDVGVDILEALDFVGGLVFIDFRDDDF